MSGQGKLEMVVLRSIIWAIAGGFFGAVYLAFLRFLEFEGLATWHVVAAAAVAGATVATFYSAKRVALVGALVGTATAIVRTIITGVPPEPWFLLALAAVLGFAAGAGISAIYEHRRGALMLALGGLASGVFAGLVLMALRAFFPFMALPLFQALALVIVTGVTFTFLSLWLGRHYRGLLPQWLAVGLVASGIAAVVATGVWVMSATLDFDLDPALQVALRTMFEQLPLAVTGGALGGALAGASLEVGRVPWMLRL